MYDEQIYKFSIWIRLYLHPKMKIILNTHFIKLDELLTFGNVFINGTNNANIDLN